MLTYNQRYKPRTTREYTKSDLTVYDSAGNTALNTLKVYGKSEVVDGVIKSAGEGWSVVDLGTLTWSYDSSQKRFYAQYTNMLAPTTGNALASLLCPDYTIITYNEITTSETNMVIAAVKFTYQYLNIRNTSYTDPVTFKAAMSGVLLCYQLADPTQGNAIAVKTDNGSGIDGTMAVFETGTPLYGVSDTVRDVMMWNGLVRTVTKKCNKIRLADLTWSYRNNSVFSTEYLTDYQYSENVKAICAKYNYVGTIHTITYMDDKPDKSIALYYQNELDARSLYIKDTDHTTVSDFVASLGDAELVYELASPTTQPLTQTENESIAGLRTFNGTTHFTNNATTDMTVNYTIKVPTI